MRSDSGLVIQGCDGLILVFHTFDGEVAKANMNLIAAAPELYQALDDLLLMTIKINLGQPPSYEEQMAIRDRAAKALLKAKGLRSAPGKDLSLGQSTKLAQPTSAL